MSKKIIRLIAFIISVIMVACFAVGCSGDNDPSSNIPSGDDTTKISGLLDEVNPADYKGTTVVYATWKDPWQNEDGDAVNAFVNKYGINFEVKLINEGEYINTIASMIATDQQVDVMFQNVSFPGSLTVMQPLDAAKLDLSDPFWNQSLLKASTIDGHPYLLDAIGNVWTEVDICVYNKSLFENNGITTPTEYYEQGKWTFANFRDVAAQISALGREYTGATILGDAMMGAAGSSFFTFKNGEMSVSVDDKLYQVVNTLSQMRVDGYIRQGRQEFGLGKFGMAITNCFGLKRTGYFSKMNHDDVAATYVPTWEEGGEQYLSGIYRGWGLVEGADNPVAAGIFLREYLDVGNYDLEKTFHNEEVANFFFEVTSTYSENIVYYHDVSMYVTLGMGTSFSNASWMDYTPSNTKMYIDSQLNLMYEMRDKANEIIDDEREWIKKAEEQGIINKLSQ